ncbi:MAG: hypothetical protein M1822_006036 [Bathelium mastoideum]|nr:MAG: hypothetical protein M1822_006036 [Bathelium mastoideum]
MPALRTRDLIPPDKFHALFSKQKATLYTDHTLPHHHHHHHTSSSRTSNTPRPLAPTLSWAPLGNLVATASERTVRVWNPERPVAKNSTELRGHTGYVDGVAFHPRREAELASGGSDGVVRLWDVRAKRATGEIKVGGAGGVGQQGGVYRIAWSPDGKEMVVGRTEKKKGSKDREDTLISISLATLSEIGQYPQPAETPSFAFSNSGRELFTTTSLGTINVLDYPSFETLHSIRGHVAACHSVAISPTGANLATGGSDSLVLIWDTHDWMPKYSITDFVGTVRNISYSFDGSYVVGGSDEGSGLTVTHVESGDAVTTVATVGEKGVGCVGWHPNRYALAYTGDPSGLRIVGGIASS